jgi:hypothetical protein
MLSEAAVAVVEIPALLLLALALVVAAVLLEALQAVMA